MGGTSTAACAADVFAGATAACTLAAGADAAPAAVAFAGAVTAAGFAAAGFAAAGFAAGFAAAGATSAGAVAFAAGMASAAPAAGAAALAFTAVAAAGVEAAPAVALAAGVAAAGAGLAGATAGTAHSAFQLQRGAGKSLPTLTKADVHDQIAQLHPIVVRCGLTGTKRMQVWLDSTGKMCTWGYRGPCICSSTNACACHRNARAWIRKGICFSAPRRLCPSMLLRAGCII